MTDKADRAAFRIYEKALAMSPGKRQAYLAETCGDNEQLSKQVLAMIAAAEAPDSLLEDVIGKGIQAVFAKKQHAIKLGDRIGAYRLEGLLGRGGMGEVYLAIREDGVSMKAAVKICLVGPDDQALIKRFQQERDILASLKHPNIARLYDAGTTAENRPYFIMEHVTGKPIDVFCREQRLTLDQRLILFRKVCSAVSYAHRNLVLHRDIKPANILVTPEGEPKLLDFGISGLMNPGTVTTNTQTVLGMTPGYASPEQLDHRRLTAASDIYALGVLLYLLLTEKLPIPTEGISPMAFFNMVRENQIIKPSAAIAIDDPAQAQALCTTPEAIRRKLQGDMDTIILHALSKAPEARYSSVEAFSLEIGRFQKGLPILVRKPTVGYRTRKFIGRNTWPLATAAFLLALLVSFAVTVFYQKQQTEIERNSARNERDTSRQIANFLAQTFRGADPNQAGGEILTAKELLDQGATRIETQLNHQPHVQANLMEIMGTAYRNLGNYQQAQPLLAEALALQRKHKGPAHSDTISSLNALGLLYKDMAEYDRAEVLLREAVALRRNNDDPNALASALSSLGLLLSDKGNKSETEILFREAYSLQERISDRTLAAVVNNLGLLLKDTGNQEAAEPFLIQALDLHRRLNPDPHPAIATSLNNLGLLAKEKGDLKAAETHWRDSLAMRRELYQPDHPKMMTSLNNLAAVLKDKGDLDAAESLFREVLELKRLQYQPRHPKLITSLNNLGVLLVDKGDLAGAEGHLEEALAIARNKLAPDHLFLWVLMRNQALLRLSQGRSQESYHLAAAAVVGMRKIQKPDSLHLVLAEGILGGALLTAGRYREAEPLLESSYRYLNAKNRQFPLHSQRLRTWLTTLYEQTDQPQKAARIHLPSHQ